MGQAETNLHAKIGKFAIISAKRRHQAYEPCSVPVDQGRRVHASLSDIAGKILPLDRERRGGRAGEGSLKAEGYAGQRMWPGHPARHRADTEERVEASVVPNAGGGVVDSMILHVSRQVKAGGSFLGEFCLMPLHAGECGIRRTQSKPLAYFHRAGENPVIPIAGQIL